MHSGYEESRAPQESKKAFFELIVKCMQAGQTKTLKETPCLIERCLTLTTLVQLPHVQVEVKVFVVGVVPNCFGV